VFYAVIRIARADKLFRDVAEVGVDALPIVTPRSLPQADRVAHEEVCASSNLIEHEPLRFGGRVTVGDLRPSFHPHGQGHHGWDAFKITFSHQWPRIIPTFTSSH
jgi:hypothetical protein